MKSCSEWTIKEFKTLPLAKWNEEIVCNSLIIFPQKRINDSGYRLLEFIAVNEKGIPFKRISGCSDVISLDGMGGYGDDWIKHINGIPKLIPISAWGIDSLKKSGLLRIFSLKGKIKTGISLSNFEVFKIDIK